MRIQQDAGQKQWEFGDVISPHLDHPVSVVAAKDIPYVPDGNRFQNLSIYLSKTPETSSLIGTPANSLPNPNSHSSSLATTYTSTAARGVTRNSPLTRSNLP